MRSLRRWTVRSLRALTLAAAAAGFTAGAAAQDVDSRASNFKKTFTKTTTFKLPIQMDERIRANLKEVQLYVKSGNGDWVRQEAVPPTTPHFDYRVPGDGEYWFSLVTVDKFGKMSPSDVANEPPALRVIVDTRPPAVEVQPGMGPDGSFLIRCNAVDANMEGSTLKAIVKSIEGDRPLTMVEPGIYKINRTDLDAPIHVTAVDMAGNVGMKEVTGRELFAAVAPPPAPPQIPTAPPALPGGITAAKNPLAIPPAGGVQPPPVAQVSGGPAIVPPSIPPVLPPSATGNGLPAVVPPAVATPGVNPLPGPGLDPATTVTGYTPQPNTPPVTSKSPAKTSGNRQLISTTQAQIEYRLDSVGQSGISKVEVYMTSDGGQRWTRLAEDADRRSPVDVELPGDGTFGIRFVVTNGNGFSSKAPQSGDQPLTTIEVDTTPPFLQLRPVELNPASGTIDIRWTATDKNLGEEPIAIFCKTTPDGAWQPVVRNLRNEGAYRWTFPRDLGQQFFIKVEATDLAGNISRQETPNPIVLDTMVPTVDVVGVTGVSVRPK